MKSNLTKLSLALVSAVFILSCQDQGTGPVAADGPGPQFAVDCDAKPDHPKCSGGGGGGGEEASFTVTHRGDYFTTGDPITGRPGSGKPGTSIGFGTVHDFETIVLSERFVGQLAEFGDIDKCFKKVNGRRAFDLDGGLRARKGNIVTGSYFFRAFGTDGTTKVAYGLEVTGTANGAFVPASNQTIEVEWTDGLLHAPGDPPACVGGGGTHSAQKHVTISDESESFESVVTIVGDPSP